MTISSMRTLSDSGSPPGLRRLSWCVVVALRANRLYKYGVEAHYGWVVREFARLSDLTVIQCDHNFCNLASSLHCRLIGQLHSI